jgi:hypothetical protein
MFIVGITTGNGRFARYKILCRVLFIGHPAKALFAECQTQRHPAKKNRPKARPSAKVVDVTPATCRHPSPSVAPLGTRQRIFYFLKKFFAGWPLT